MSKIWYTSDTHFGSERTLELSKRPFKSVEEMDNTIISNWNKVVAPEDYVFHLGDFGDYKRVKELNGKIVLVKGNYENKDILTTLEDFKNYGFIRVYDPNVQYRAYTNGQVVIDDIAPGNVGLDWLRRPKMIDFNISSIPEWIQQGFKLKKGGKIESNS